MLHHSNKSLFNRIVNDSIPAALLALFCIVHLRDWGITMFASHFRYAAALLAILVSSTAWADPPSRVGRIGYLEGDVSFFANSSDGWQVARLNYPVTSKNSIWVNGAGRAEVRIGSAALRADADTVLDLARVDDKSASTFLQRGTLNIRIRQDGRDDIRDNFRVETNEGVALLDTNGRYRIDATPDRAETRVIAFLGRARFQSNGNTLIVEPGKTLLIRQSLGTPTFAFEGASETVFDRWAEARDRRWDESHQRYASSQRDVSPGMTGYEDLDEYGEWVDDGEYGRLWTPRVVTTGWVPYRYGSWAYVRPWGWTWIDDAAWGFAPFHYGRWVFRNTRWCWWPGGYSRHPVYAPALVGWVGRPNWSVSVSVGSTVGWFPLAPREHFIPAYTNNVTYIRNINNVTNNITVINPPSNYANQASGGTMVNHGVMLNGEPVWRHAGVTTKPLLDRRVNTPTPLPQATMTPPSIPPANAIPRNWSQTRQVQQAPQPFAPRVAGNSGAPGTGNANGNNNVPPAVINSAPAIGGEPVRRPQTAATPKPLLVSPPQPASSPAPVVAPVVAGTPPQPRYRENSGNSGSGGNSGNNGYSGSANANVNTNANVSTNSSPNPNTNAPHVTGAPARPTQDHVMPVDRTTPTERASRVRADQAEHRQNHDNRAPAVPRENIVQHKAPAKVVQEEKVGHVQNDANKQQANR